MPLTRFQEDSLDYFEDIMQDRSQDYTYTGSTAMALHGIDVYPSDIDIVATEETFDEINDLFLDEEPRQIGKRIYRGEAHSSRAVMLELDIGTTKFEILKNAKYRLGGESFNLEDRQTQKITYKDKELNVVSLEDLRKIYKLGGRTEKADTVLDFLLEHKTQERQKEIQSLGHPEDPIEYLELTH